MEGGSGAAGRRGRCLRRSVVCGLMILFPVTPGNAQSNDAPPVTARLGAQLQLRYTHDQPEGGNQFAVRRGRLALNGTAYEDFDYSIQVDLAGSSAQLLDAFVRYTPVPSATFWLGQGKIWFGRQFLTSSRNLHFVERSIASARFEGGRDQGVGFIGRPAGDLLEVDLGVYNGNGPRRNANPDGQLLTVARVVLTPNGPYRPMEGAFDRPDRTLVALGVAGLRNTTTEGEAETEEVLRLGLEAALRRGGWNGTAELFREEAEPEGGPVRRTSGWYVQAGYLLPGNRFEFALRHAVLRPRGDHEPERSESGMAWSAYLHGHDAKVQADLRSISESGIRRDRTELRVQLQIAF